MKKALLLTGLVLLFTTGFAQQKSKKPHRPKVAVVLSGGGAKGMAHVGFLRVMEKAGIHPDIIVGTSMGSIVGGLYSIGFSPDSLQKMMDEQDWDLVLGNKVSLRYINIEEKREYDNYIAEFPLKGIVPQLPSGAIKGHELELLFDKLTWTAAQDTNFDNFPIAFRCVAVDMLSAKPYVFKSGSLSLAMRASMSIPTIMEPIKYKGMLLVDGGLINNFPVDVAKKMGADIIIGVYVGGKMNPTEEQLNTLIPLLTQSQLLCSIVDAKKKKGMLDVFIEPPLDDLTAADFNKADIFIKRGYDESMKYFDKLKKIAEKINSSGPAKIKKSHLIDSVKVLSFETNEIKNKNTRRMIYNSLDEINKGYIKAGDIHAAINKLYGTRLFDKIGYQLLPSKTDSGAFIIKYDFKESPTNFLNFAFNYSTDKKMSLILQTVFRNLILPSSKLEAKFQISEYPSAYVRYLKYLGKANRNSFWFAFRNDNSLMSFYNSSGDKIISQYKRKYNSFSMGITHYRSLQSEISLFFSRQFFNYNSTLELPMGEFVKYKMNNNNLGIRYAYNYLDQKYFPKKGSRILLTALYSTNQDIDLYYAPDDTLYQSEDGHLDVLDSNNLLLRFYFENHHSFGKLTLSNNVDLFATYLPGSSLNSFLVGGLNDYGYFHNIPFFGLPLNYYFANTGLIYRFSARYEFLKNIYTFATVNGMYETPDYRRTFLALGESDSYLFGGGVGLSYKSKIGPISLAISKNLSFGPFWAYFNIGYNF